MGNGYEITCSHCGHIKTIQFGVGLSYGGLDDLTPTSFNILHLVDSAHIQSVVKALIEEKNGSLDVLRDSGHSLYLCPKCEVLHNNFWFKLRHDDGVYEPDYLCEHCNTELRHISGDFGEVNHARCPECWNKGTLSVDNMVLINWD